MKYLVLSGPESTGKTTLAKALAETHKCTLLSEYAREYLADRRNYTPSDLAQIAYFQHEQELQLAHSSEDLCVVDTDVQVIRIWWRYRYGSLPNWLVHLSKSCAQTSRLYLLCTPDLSWVPDPLRENPHDRQDLFHRYLDDAQKRDLTYGIVAGHSDERVESALGLVAKFV